MSARRLIVFDVDGTLIDSQHVILSAMRGAFAHLDRPAPGAAEILGIVGLSLPEAMAELAPDLPAAERALLSRHYRESFVEQRASGQDEPPLYPGARDALARLEARADTLLGGATGKARRGLDHILAAHALGRVFATAQTADGHPSKPHPSMLHTALRETGCAADRAVMIGDTEFDIAMGRAAGFATIAVVWGYHPRARLIAAGADAVIETYDALDDALAELGR